MNQHVKHLADAARKLTLEEQAELVDDLLVSLHEQGDDWDTAWAAEAERRWALYKSGELAAHDADEVLADVSQRLAKRRAK